MNTATTPQSVDFEGLRIEYDEHVLAPRPWTAAQSRWAAELIRVAPPGPVLEVCSGAGHIGLLAVTARTPVAGVRRRRPGRLCVPAPQRRRPPGCRSTCARDRMDEVLARTRSSR